MSVCVLQKQTRSTSNSQPNTRQNSGRAKMRSGRGRGHLEMKHSIMLTLIGGVAEWWWVWMNGHFAHMVLRTSAPPNAGWHYKVQHHP